MSDPYAKRQPRSPSRPVSSRRTCSTTSSGEPPRSTSRAVPSSRDSRAASSPTVPRSPRIRTASRETISPTASSRTAVRMSSPSAMATCSYGLVRKKPKQAAAERAARAPAARLPRADTATTTTTSTRAMFVVDRSVRSGTSARAADKGATRPTTRASRSRNRYPDM
ncbi:hypothetical protein ACVWXU_002752 [Streptomyces sp. TE33382]